MAAALSVLDELLSSLPVGVESSRESVTSSSASVEGCGEEEREEGTTAEPKEGTEGERDDTKRESGMSLTEKGQEQAVKREEEGVDTRVEARRHRHGEPECSTGQKEEEEDKEPVSDIDRQVDKEARLQVLLRLLRLACEMVSILHSLLTFK